VTDDAILSGEPIINGTRTPVRAIVELWRGGLPPEEIPSHLPHLNMAQIFDALSYYSEKQDEINSYIERNRIPDHLLFEQDKAECIRRINSHPYHPCVPPASRRSCSAIVESTRPINRGRNEESVDLHIEKGRTAMSLLRDSRF